MWPPKTCLYHTHPPEKVTAHHQTIIFLSTFQKGRRIFQAQMSFCGGEFILPEMIEIV